MQDGKTSVQVNKVDADTGKGLAGATLRVTDSSGKKIDEWVSDGKAHEVLGLAVGQTYTLTEVKVPDGYTTADPVKFTVKNTGETQTVTMKDVRTTYRVNKVDESGNGLAGATLRVTDASGKKIDEWVSDGKAHEIKSLVVGQTYTLTEVKAPEGYVTADPVKFTVRDTDSVQTVTMKDVKTTYRVNKVDEAGKGLAGATLRVTDAGGKKIDEWVSDGKAHEIKGLVVGQTYTLTEVKAPEGYVTADPVKFTVRDTDSVQTVTMKDVKTTYRVNKVDEAGKGLAGATLRVTDAGGKKIDEWVSDGKAHEIKGLVVGQTYTLTEVKAPEGYVTADPVKFTVRDTDSVQTVTMKDVKTTYRVNKVDEAGKGLAGATLRVTDAGGKKIDEWVSDGKAHEIKGLVVGQTYTLTEVKAPEGYVTADPVKFTVRDTDSVQTVTMKDVKTTYRVNKVDEAGKGLAGATLRVTDAGGKKIDEWVSDGKAHEIKSLVVGQTYTLTEVKVPDGYVTADPVKFTVKDTDSVQTVTMKDVKTTYRVNKVDENGNGLAGATLRVTDAGGKKIDEWVSDGKAHEIKSLVVGQTYTLTEVKAPEGYVTADPVKFTVRDTDSVQTVTMKDVRTTYRVNKVDESGNGLAGATLRVTDAGGKKIDEWVSDGKAHEIKSLVVGQTYTLTEVKVPDGYVTADPVKFTVKDTDSVQTVTMKDVKTTYRVNKVDENGNGLAGATLRVTDAGGKKIDEWVSDGKAHEIKSLVVGQTYTLTEVKAPEGYVTADPCEVYSARYRFRPDGDDERCQNDLQSQQS